LLNCFCAKVPILRCTGGLSPHVAQQGIYLEKSSRYRLEHLETTEMVYLVEMLEETLKYRDLVLEFKASFVSADRYTFT